MIKFKIFLQINWKIFYLRLLKYIFFLAKPTLLQKRIIATDSNNLFILTLQVKLHSSLNMDNTSMEKKTRQLFPKS